MEEDGHGDADALRSSRSTRSSRRRERRPAASALAAVPATDCPQKCHGLRPVACAATTRRSRNPSRCKFSTRSSRGRRRARQLLSQLSSGQRPARSTSCACGRASDACCPAAPLASARAIDAARGRRVAIARPRWGCLHHLCASQAAEQRARCASWCAQAPTSTRGRRRGGCRSTSRRTTAATSCSLRADVSARESGARDAAGHGAHYVALAGLDLPAAAAAQRAAPPRPPPDPPPRRRRGRAARSCCGCPRRARRRRRGLTAAALAAIVDPPTSPTRCAAPSARRRADSRALLACMCLAFALAHASRCSSRPAVDGAWAPPSSPRSASSRSAAGVALAGRPAAQERHATAAPRAGMRASWCFACRLCGRCAKHCRKCGRIRGFDPLPWINNCVGEGNPASLRLRRRRRRRRRAAPPSRSTPRRARPGDDYGGTWVCGMAAALRTGARVVGGGGGDEVVSSRRARRAAAALALPRQPHAQRHRQHHDERADQHEAVRHFKRSTAPSTVRPRALQLPAVLGLLRRRGGRPLRVQYSRELVEEVGRPTCELSSCVRGGGGPSVHAERPGAPAVAVETPGRRTPAGAGGTPGSSPARRRASRRCRRRSPRTSADLERIERGSFGEVFRGVDSKTSGGRRQDHRPRAGGGRDRRHPAGDRRGGAIDSPYVTGTAPFVSRTQLWIIMEYVGGGSILDMMDNGARQGVDPTIMQVLKGLDYLHTEEDPRHQGGERALAQRRREARRRRGQLTDTMSKCQTFVGTPFWMAPEVIRQDQYDSRADIWSLSISTLQMCNGILTPTSCRARDPRRSPPRRPLNGER